MSEKVVMGYQSIDLQKYALIKLGNGYTDDIIKLARSNNITPEKMIRLSIDEYAENIKNKAKNL